MALLLDVVLTAVMTDDVSASTMIDCAWTAGMKDTVVTFLLQSNLGTIDGH